MLGANELISFSLALRPRNDVPSGKKPRRLHHHELAANHGAHEQDLRYVLDFAKHEGLTVRAAHPLRRSVELQGPASVVARLFGVELGRFRRGAHRYHRHDGAYVLPEALRGVVHGVFGLDARPIAKGNLRLAPRTSEGVTGQRPEKIAEIYGFPQGSTGKGQTIGIVALGGRYREADLLAYLSTERLARSVAIVEIDNEPQVVSEDADIELMMDIEIAAAIASDAKIVVYLSPNTTKGLKAMHELDRVFRAAASLGITILTASGDNGSSDGVADSQAHVDFPASSPQPSAPFGATL